MKKLLLAFFALPMITTAQTTVNFDDAAKWTNGTSPIGSYGDNHTYVDGTFSSTCTQCLRETTALGGGLPGANGTYAYRLRNADDASFVATISSGGVSTFSVNIRRWDDSPNPQFDIEYSTNGGTSWTFVTLINNAALDNSSNYKIFNGTINNSNNNILIRISNLNYSASERIMVDDFTWSPYVAPGCNIATADLTALTCNDNTTTADPADDYISFSLNPTGSQLGATYTVSVSSGTITPTTGTYGAATSFQLQDGSAGAGNVTVTITDADESGCTLDVAITDPGSCSSAVPVITATPATLTGFNHQVGTPSASQPFTVSGIALSDDITVTAPTGFEVSLDNTTFTASVTLTPVSGTVAATTVHARGNAAIYGPLSGNIIASSTGADNDTVAVSGFADDYVYYTIDQINGTDANGAADSLNVLVTITGVLHCMDFRAGSGYNMAIIDGSGEGMYIFATNDVSGYTTPMAGDSIEVKGIIDQFNGLLQVRAHAITLLESGVATNAPIVVTALNESTENQYVTLENVTLVTPIATFPTTNTNLDVTDGTTTFQIRILTSTNLGGTPAPQGPFNVTGIGSQFDSSSPYTSGYQLLPCGTDAIEIVCAGANLPNLAVTTAGMTATATATGMTYQWINCADNSPVSGATNRTYTATTAGSYAVIIDNGTCADTSACVALAGVSVESVELGQSIVAYPNPVNELLTINNYSNMDVTYTITDINGKVISETAVISSVATVNTLSWNRGVYFVTFNGANNATHTLKVIK
ncbi:T9SS type A sorting domain-containing protein [Crocinitomicaceae bacterium CZZ-1]|uniref:T9SS type A sorting domain-containing protein n=1 Tax=Taishania pollutisoli TaxID=2766479 RepID=A0A8J6PAC1_9FLAO|nr:T9SS type A sorting domain-containing protein [Taishania pollutisoli]MBC9811007.1 T9SS type A sorting domain-containing protein [Taishania pollutisoli]